jgi:plasmid stabilization system protein ParE
MIVVSPKAQDDMREAYEYIARDSRESADRVLARIVEVIGMLASGGVAGREVVLRDGRHVQTWAVPPYRISYRRTTEVLQVVRVYHQARHPIEQ